MVAWYRGNVFEQTPDSLSGINLLKFRKDMYENVFQTIKSAFSNPTAKLIEKSGKSVTL